MTGSGALGVLAFKCVCDSTFLRARLSGEHPSGPGERERWARAFSWASRAPRTRRRIGLGWRSAFQTTSCLCDLLPVATVRRVALPLCPNCGKPARYMHIYDDGSELASCGSCRAGFPASIRELASGDEFAPREAAPALREWSTVAEVAARHKLAPKTIRGYIRTGELAAHGGPPQPYRVHRDDERAWDESRHGTRASGPPTVSPKRAKARGSTFTDLARKR